MPEQKILADEHISRTVVSKLSSYGIDTVHIEDVGLRGSSDEYIADYAAENGRIVLTRDDDFKQLADSKGVGVLYLTKRLRKDRTAEEVMKVMNSMTMQGLEGEIIHLPWN
ncbi:MAG: DUF5615 family PIN-like protein [Candidatus Nanohalobium sp.]